MKLKAFYKFTDTTEALAATSALVESKLSKTLKSFLKKHIVKKELTDELAVADSKLGGVIKDKLGISCVADSRVNELMRGIRSQMSEVIEGLDDVQIRAMQLGLGHTLSRYKLKFSPDKVDTMIVQVRGCREKSWAAFLGALYPPPPPLPLPPFVATTSLLRRRSGS